MTADQVNDGTGRTPTAGAEPVSGTLTLRVDGRHLLSAEAVAAVGAVCDSAEDLDGRARVVVQVSGVPRGPWPDDLTVSLVNKWERALRRLERLPAPTIAVADGDCGGLALDAMLAADYRIATRTVRLVVPVAGGATWPGMALYRLVAYGANGAAIRRAVLYGTPVDAVDAHALQLVDELTGDAAEALARAGERVRAVAGTELAIRRQLLSDAATTSFDEALGVHLAACDRALRRAAREADA
ncbi:enoyl-CoA-hydratase DpgB [Streptomyces sp. NPDC048484]|uniref:enoyl-CoA-hydratase DpgB n=1 Tax=Streptomyces sp. NPDC048484 TaxID=3155146 RepID=UPI0034260479